VNFFSKQLIFVVNVDYMMEHKHLHTLFQFVLCWF